MGSPVVAFLGILVPINVFGFLVMLAGPSSAVWFGIGFITCAILAFWEAGRLNRRTQSNRNAGEI